MSLDDDTTDDAFAGDLAPVTMALRAHYLQPPSDEVAERHLARMMAAVSADGVIDLDTIDLRAPRRARRVVVASLVGASVLSLSGLAAAGVLPAPVQSRVAAMVQPLGLQLPGGVDAPGQSEDAPGHGGTGPGQSEDAPGRGGDSPGRSEDAPGQGGENPGNENQGKSDEAPGQGGENPGKSDEAPGQGGENPGKSDPAPTVAQSAPGQGGENPGQSDQAPGQGGQNPGNPGGKPAVSTTTTAVKTPPSNAGNDGGSGKGQQKP